ncbi:MAG: hypothetical protein K5756_06355 [Clostridiales bacterium]|nr:hypothetical protein [Clostridiales bacterium]
MSIITWFESVLLTISLIISAVSGFFTNAPAKTARLLEKTDGYICGVCHPDENYGALKDAGLGWVRFDIPYPYNSDGSISGSYTAFKNRAKGYAERGIKIMAITPYPRSYFDIGGFDPSADENIQRTQDIAVFLCNDLRDIVSGIQITNEMGVTTFTLPLNLEQAAKFIGIQAEALNNVKGDIIVGYNTAGENQKLHKLLKPYLSYMDYVGVDLYYGSWGDGTLRDYVNALRDVNMWTGKPIIIEEFGYLSKGAPKTAEEKAAKLARYGYDSEEAARADIENFVKRLPPAFQGRIYEAHSEPAEWGDAVFKDSHFYGELTASIKGIPHTFDGQAEYYRQLIPVLKQVDCLAGFFIYCWRDSTVCWYCGQDDCPFETAWGITDLNGVPKPAYYAVKESIAGFSD